MSANQQKQEKPKPAYVTKPVLETMDEFQSFNEYCGREGLADADKVCTVSPDIFDLLAKGTDAPLIHYRNVKVFNSETKEQVLKDLQKNINGIIIR